MNHFKNHSRQRAARIYRTSIILLTALLLTSHTGFGGPKPTPTTSLAVLNGEAGQLREATVTEAQTSFHTVALQSDLAPPEVGGRYSEFPSASVSDTGSVAFSATISGSPVGSALMLRTAQETRVILRAGDAAPRGGRFKAFGEVDASRHKTAQYDSDSILFRALLEGGNASEGVFLWSPDGVEVVALEGEASPRGRIYKSFSQLTAADPTGEALRIAFVANMTGKTKGGKSIIFKDFFGDRKLIEKLSTGDKLGKNLVDDFVISPVLISVAAVVDTHPKKKKQRRIREYTLVDPHFVIHGGPLAEGAEVSPLGTITRIQSPPAINGQTGFVSVEMGSGASGLVRQEVFGDATLFAKTGDPAPGVTGASIQSFGPPVASVLWSHYPEYFGNLGIISPVVLSNGQRALWVGIYPDFNLDLSAQLMLIDGEPLGATGSLRLRTFSPVELGNRGSLLLRGEIDGPEGAIKGLFLLGGLFTDPS